MVTGWRTDWVFRDLIDRLVQADAEFVVTETPIPEADVWHYWRPQAAKGQDDLSRAVLSCHGFGEWGKGHPIYDQGTLEAFGRAKVCVGLNDMDCARLGRLGTGWVKKIPHAVDASHFTLRPPNTGGLLRIGRVGRPYGAPRPDNVKGRDVLQSVIARLGDSVEWVFLGEQWEAEEQVCRERGIPVTYHSRLAGFGHSRYPDAYHQMDVFLVTSRSEGGPASLPEAMACGVCPVVTSVGMCFDLVSHNENGYVYPPNKPVYLASLLSGLHLPTLNDMRELIRETVADYGWDDWRGKYLEAYQIATKE